MDIVITDELKEYMRKRRRRVIAVEVASSTHSDFEVTELYLRLVPDGQVQQMKEKKHYRGIPCGEFEVLLPNYRLEYAEQILSVMREL